MREVDNHPPMGPEATIAWLDAVLAGKMPANRVLLLRLRRLAVMGAESQAGKTASKRARDDYRMQVVGDCLHLPDVKGERDACLLASDTLRARPNTLRDQYRTWMKNRETSSS